MRRSSLQQYGDIAHVMSTYEKHRWGDTTVAGRGINSIQLVRKDNRWWVTSIIWDEETGAGPVPAKYLPARRRSSTQPRCDLADPARVTPDVSRTHDEMRTCA